MLFDVIFNFHKFLRFESRDPFQEKLKREDGFRTDWDRYASGEYLRLCMEDDMSNYAGMDVDGGALQTYSEAKGSGAATQQSKGDKAQTAEWDESANDSKYAELDDGARLAAGGGKQAGAKQKAVATAQSSVAAAGSTLRNTGAFFRRK